MSARSGHGKSPGPSHGKAPLPDSEGEHVENTEPAVIPDSAYEGIVLVPAEPLPPENVPEPEPAAEEVPAEPEQEAAPAEEVKEEVPAEPAEDILSRYITEESALKKGSFYIQVASFSRKENAEALIKKYPRYPYAVIITRSGSYKILAGPLNEDEYGAVFERFKSYGFKDAFVKKIN